MRQVRGPYVGDMTDERTTDQREVTLRDVMADAREVVLHWREAHATLGDVPSDGDEAARLRTEMAELREEYARLIEEARRYARDASTFPRTWPYLDA